MKKYIYTLLATLPFIFLAGCSKEDAPLPVDKGLAGEWVLTSWNGTAPGEDFGVYMELADNGNFTLYEKVVTPAYVRYSGTYTADGRLTQPPLRQAPKAADSCRRAMSAFPDMK